MSHGRLRLRGWLTPCSALSNVYANRSSLGTGVREIAQRAARASQLLEQETKALMTWLQAKGCGVERSPAGAPRRACHDQAPAAGRGARRRRPATTRFGRPGSRRTWRTGGRDVSKIAGSTGRPRSRRSRTPPVAVVAGAAISTESSTWAAELRGGSCRGKTSGGTASVRRSWNLRWHERQVGRGQHLQRNGPPPSNHVEPGHFRRQADHQEPPSCRRACPWHVGRWRYAGDRAARLPLVGT